MYNGIYFGEARTQQVTVLFDFAESKKKNIHKNIQRQYKTHFDYIYKMLHIIFPFTLYSLEQAANKIFDLFVVRKRKRWNRNSVFHAGGFWHRKKNAIHIFLINIVLWENAMQTSVLLYICTRILTIFKQHKYFRMRIYWNM